MHWPRKDLTKPLYTDMRKTEGYIFEIEYETGRDAYLKAVPWDDFTKYLNVDGHIVRRRVLKSTVAKHFKEIKCRKEFTPEELEEDIDPAEWE